MSKAFRTKSGSVSAEGRRKAKSAGDTMPGTGGKFPIRNLSDLSNAKHDIGRTTEPHAKVVAWIDKRAKELHGSPVGGSKPHEFRPPATSNAHGYKGTQKSGAYRMSGHPGAHRIGGK